MFKLRLLVLYYRVLGFLSWLRERGDRRHTSRAVRLQLYRVEFSGSNFCEGEITLMNMTDKQQVLVHLRPLDARNLPAVVKEGSVDWHVDNENIEWVLEKGYRWLMTSAGRSYGSLNKARELTGRA